MSAWTNLLAASSLAIGSAWDLITHPRTGGSGGTVLVADAVAMVADTLMSAAIDDTASSVTVTTNTVHAAVMDGVYAAYIPDTAGQGTVNDASSAAVVANNII